MPNQTLQQINQTKSYLERVFELSIVTDTINQFGKVFSSNNLMIKTEKVDLILC